MTLEDLAPTQITKQELIEALTQRLIIRGKALVNLKEDLGPDFDRDRAEHLYRALEDTISILRGDAAQYCTMKQILHHADLIVFKGNVNHQEQTADLFKAVREELKTFHHLQNSIAA